MKLATVCIAVLLSFELVAPAWSRGSVCGTPPTPFHTDDSGTMIVKPRGWPEQLSNVLQSLRCPLKHTSVSAVVYGSVATVDVTQEFQNDFDYPIEASYMFPLPEHAAVDRMIIRIGEQEIRGSIKETKEARAVFDAARASGATASLLEQTRPNVFEQQITNIPAHAKVSIKLHYVDLLPFMAGAYTFAFPTVVGPRFDPHAESSSSGSGLGTERREKRPGHDISIEVELHAGTKIEALKSELHQVDSTSTGKDAIVSLTQENEIPNRDFILTWLVSRDAIATNALVNSENGKGYVLLTVLPPVAPKAEMIKPKEMIFVVDRSLSQEGDPLEKCQQTLLYAVENLHPDDTFQMLSFCHDVQSLFPSGPVALNQETKAQAIKWIKDLVCGSETLVVPALQKVFDYPEDAKRLRVVCLMTDGQVSNEQEALTLLKQRKGQSRWFTFGTGNAVNRYFIESVAEIGGGEPEYVSSFTAADEVARSFYNRISSPLMTNVSVSFDGGSVSDVQPARAQDLWSDRPLYVVARYDSAGKTQAHISGLCAGKSYTETVSIELPYRTKRNEALRSLWARKTIDGLLASSVEGSEVGESADVPVSSAKKKIVDLSVAYGVLSPFTSFVAVADGAPKVEGKVVPVAVPAAEAANGLLGYHYNENSGSGGVAGYGGTGLVPPAPALTLGNGGTVNISAQIPTAQDSSAYRAYPAFPAASVRNGGTSFNSAAVDPGSQTIRANVRLNFAPSLHAQFKPRDGANITLNASSAPLTDFVQVDPTVLDQRYKRSWEQGAKTVLLPGVLPPDGPQARYMDSRLSSELFFLLMGTNKKPEEQISVVVLIGDESSKAAKERLTKLGLSIEKSEVTKDSPHLHLFGKVAIKDIPRLLLDPSVDMLGAGSRNQ